MILNFFLRNHYKKMLSYFILIFCLNNVLIPCATWNSRVHDDKWPLAHHRTELALLNNSKINSPNVAKCEQI
jgi:hypothetical protein